MYRRFILALIVMTLWTGIGQAQNALPAIAPTATYTDSDGSEQTETSVSASAPLTVTFKANAENTDGWTAHYEWHFYKEGLRDQPYLVRYDEQTTYTFTEAGRRFG